MGGGEVGKVAHGEIIELLIGKSMLLAKHTDDLHLGVGYLVGRGRRHQDAAHVNTVLAHHPGFECYPGHHHQIVLVLSLGRLTLANQHSDYFAGHGFYSHDLAKRLARSEELRCDGLSKHADLGA